MARYAIRGGETRSIGAHCPRPGGRPRLRPYRADQHAEPCARPARRRAPARRDRRLPPRRRERGAPRPHGARRAGSPSGRRGRRRSRAAARRAG
ncbi:hypothetical protein FJ251_14680 [bacterium]|nr:hypothetical protein [bacterium]